MLKSCKTVQGGIIFMKRILIIGSIDKARELILEMNEQLKFEVIKVLSVEEVNLDMEHWLQQDIDIIFILSENENVFLRINTYKKPNTIIITKKMILDFEKQASYFKKINKEQYYLNEILFSTIPIGIISVKLNGSIQFLNDEAEKIFSESKIALGLNIEDVLPELKLTQLFTNQLKPEPIKQKIQNGQELITILFPMRNQENQLIGAIAICKEFKEVVSFVESNIDIENLSKVFEGIVGTSYDGYVVTDTNGICHYVNKTYLEWTKMEEENVLKQAVQWNQESYKKVLKSRRSIINRQIDIGPLEKRVDMNIRPLIMNGKLKGSIGIYSQIANFEHTEKALKDSQHIIRKLERNETFDDIVSVSEEMKLVVEQAKIASKVMIPVFIRGEVGTEKKF